MSASALRMSGVTKSYGRRRALDGLSFDAPAGAITGLVGPNGAGKTTCFGVVGGLLAVDAGTIDVLGAGPFDPARDRGRLGLLPQDSELPPHARIDLWLGYLARLQGMTRGEASRDVQRVLELVRLDDRARSPVRELSHGMRRRVAVAQALLGAPRLVLLDEPTSGLDPQLVADMRDVLRDQRDVQGASVVVSSHLLGELDAVCDHVVFMQAGRCVRSASLAEVTGRSHLLRYHLDRAPELPPLREALAGLDLRSVGNVLEVRYGDGTPVDINRRVLQLLLSREFGVLEVKRGGSLEEAFLEGAEFRTSA